MGAAQSSNVIDSYSKAMTSLKNSVTSTSQSAASQSNTIAVTNVDCNGDVIIDGTGATQTGISKVSVAGYQKAMTSASAMQSVAQEVSAAAQSTLKGLNLGQFAKAENNVKTMVDSSIQMNNAIGSNCGASVNQNNVFLIDGIKSRNNCDIKAGVLQGNTADVNALCSQAGKIQADAVNTVTQKVKATASAKATGLSDFAIIAIALAVIACVMAYLVGTPVVASTVFIPALIKFAPFVAMGVGAASIFASIVIVIAGLLIPEPTLETTLQMVRTYPYTKLATPDNKTPWTTACNAFKVIKEGNAKVDVAGPDKTHNAFLAQIFGRKGDKIDGAVAYEFDDISGNYKIYGDVNGTYQAMLDDPVALSKCTGMPNPKISRFAAKTCNGEGQELCDKDGDCEDGVYCVWGRGDGPLSESNNTKPPSLVFKYPKTYLSNRAPGSGDAMTDGKHIWIVLDNTKDDKDNGTVWTRTNAMIGSRMSFGTWTKAASVGRNVEKMLKLDCGKLDCKKLGFGFCSPHDAPKQCMFSNYDGVDVTEMLNNRPTAGMCGASSIMSETSVPGAIRGKPVLCAAGSDASRKFEDLIHWVDMSDPTTWRMWSKTGGVWQVTGNKHLDGNGAGCDVSRAELQGTTWVGLKITQDRDITVVDQLAYYGYLAALKPWWARAVGGGVFAAGMIGLGIGLLAMKKKKV